MYNNKDLSLERDFSVVLYGISVVRKVYRRYVVKNKLKVKYKMEHLRKMHCNAAIKIYVVCY